MSRKHAPVFTNIEGVEVVILSRETYDVLSGQRRQLGALSNQLRALKQTLTDAAALLDEIHDTLARLPPPDANITNPQDLLQPLLRLLEERPERLRQPS